MSIHRSALCKYGIVLSLLLISTNGFAQDATEPQAHSSINPTIKVSGIAPAIGISYHLSAESSIRGLGFFTVNSSSNISNEYLLDFSYIRKIHNEKSFVPYWGINVHFQFNDPVIGPGLLLGSSYSFDDSFSVFGEAGFNTFFADDGNTTLINILNSGIGIRIDL